MNAQATARNVRVSPRKARLIADLIRGQNVVRAMALLSTLRNRAAEPVVKVLQSALANADCKTFTTGSAALLRKVLSNAIALTTFCPLIKSAISRALRGETLTFLAVA